MGASNINCQGIYTHFSSGGNIAGAITVAQTGSFCATNLWTYADYTGHGGSIMFAGGGPAAGSFIVAGGIDTHAMGKGGTIVIHGYSGVHVGSGGISAIGGWHGGSVAITNIGAGGVIFDGPITNVTIGNWDIANDVTIRTDGNVRMAGIASHAGVSSGGWVSHDSGTITLESGGDIFSSGILNTCMFGIPGYSRSAGHVILTATGRVQVAGIDTHNVNNDARRYAGDVQVTAGGDIRIDGEHLDLSSLYGGDRQGSLCLVTRGGSGKTIVFGNPTLPGTNVLDLAKLEYVLFDSATGKSWIYNTITNFVPANPNTQIRVKRDGEVVYYSVKNGANAHLLLQNNGVYPIQSLGGGMGLLRPIAGRGAVVIFR